LGYILKDEGRKKIKIDKWGIPGHPIIAPPPHPYINISVSYIILNNCGNHEMVKAFEIGTIHIPIFSTQETV
jgi:hypothetical protein